jgi:hypothetical protein
LGIILGLGVGSPAIAQGVPSDVEQRLRLQPNQGLPSDVEQRFGVRGNRPLPSDVEQQLQRRRYRQERSRYDDDDYDYDDYRDRRPRRWGHPGYRYGYY